MLLSGCENFLNGSDAKAQLEQLVKEANAPTVDIYMAAEKDAGNLSPNGIVTCKLEKPFTVFFDPSDGVEFLRWEVVDRTTGERLPDVVTFDNPKSPETKAIITKEVKNIQIKPIYIEYPRVVSSSPEYSDYGSYANTSVRINFNVPMVYKFEDIHFSFDNITISSDGQNMSEYFNLPELSDDKKTVLIKPKTDKLLSYMNTKNIETLEFVVSLDVSDIKVTVSDKNYAITETEETSFRYKIRNKTETNKPVKVPGTEVVVSRDPFTASTVSSVTQKFPSGQIDTNTAVVTKEQVIPRRVLDSVYIYGKFKDDESGIQDIIVKEKQTNSQDGKAISSLWTTGIISEKQIHVDEKGNVEFCLKYTFSSLDKYGAYTLSIAPIDCSDNVGDEELFVLFRYAKINPSAIWPYNLYDLSFSQTVAGQGNVEDEYDVTATEINERLHTIKINDTTKERVKLKYNIYGNIDCPWDKLTVSYNFNDQGYKVMNHNVDGTWKSELIEETLNGKSLKVLVVDDLGNEAFKSMMFPGEPVIRYIKRNGSSGGKYLVDILPAENSTGATSVTLNRQGTSYSCKTYNVPSKLYTAETEGVGVQRYFCLHNYCLSGELTGPETMTTTEEGSSVIVPTKLKILSSDRQIAKLNTGKTIVTIYINQNAWEYCDLIYIYYRKINPVDSSDILVPFKTGETSCSFTVDTSLLWDKNLPVTIQYNKDNTIFGSVGWDNSNKKYLYNAHMVQSFAEKPEYDNESPVISCSEYNNPPGYEDPDANGNWDIISTNYLENFGLYDAKSGIKEVRWRIGDNGVVYSSLIDDDYFYLKENYSLYDYHIPVYDMDDDISKIYVEVIDNNDNVASFNYVKTFYNPPAFIPENGIPFGSSIKYELIAACDPDENWYKQKYTILKYYVDDDLDDGDDSWWDSYDYDKWKKVDDYNSSSYKGPENKVKDGVKYYYYDDLVSFDKNTFYKIISFADKQQQTTSQSSGKPCYYGISDPYYFYTGTPSSGDSTDSLVASSNIPSMYFVNSDQPVLVNTIITKKTLSECRNWTYEKWNHRHKVINDKYFNFSSSDRKIKSYNIDLTEIPYGYCYVVVAHFANGTVKMSEVRQMK